MHYAGASFPIQYLSVMYLPDTVEHVTSHGDEVRAGLKRQRCPSLRVLSVGSNTPVVGSSRGVSFFYVDFPRFGAEHHRSLEESQTQFSTRPRGIYPYELSQYCRVRTVPRLPLAGLLQYCMAPNCQQPRTSTSSTKIQQWQSRRRNRRCSLPAQERRPPIGPRRLHHLKRFLLEFRLLRGTAHFAPCPLTAPKLILTMCKQESISLS